MNVGGSVEESAVLALKNEKKNSFWRKESKRVSMNFKAEVRLRQHYRSR
jgi:hypothetical protein